MINHWVDRITIQRATVGTDEIGGQSTTWNDEVTVWCDVKDVKGNQRVEMEQIVNGRPYVVEMYKDDFPTLTENDRIQYGDEVLNIHSIESSSQKNRFKIIAITTRK